MTQKDKNTNWKEFLAELRDGTKIYIVDGEHVRDNLDEQFTEGGHSEVYSFIPKSEIWVEHLESPSDMKENLTHELFEYYEMKEEENSYEKAHELASDIENALRRIPDYPGEQEPTKHPSNIYPHEKKESSMKIKKSAEEYTVEMYKNMLLDPLWREFQNEDITIAQSLGLRALDYHEGQDDPIYALGSSAYARSSVPVSIVEDAIYNLDLDSKEMPNDDELFDLIYELQSTLVDFFNSYKRKGKEGAAYTGHPIVRQYNTTLPPPTDYERKIYQQKEQTKLRNEYKKEMERLLKSIRQPSLEEASDEHLNYMLNVARNPFTKKDIRAVIDARKDAEQQEVQQEGQQEGQPSNIDTRIESTKEEETLQRESSMKIKKSAGLRKPKYVLYFDPKDHVEMNGRGIKYIYDAESDEKLSFEQGIEAIIEDLSGDIPEFYDYELNLYVGNATYFTYDLMVEYHPDEVPDEIVDKVGEWLDTNTFFEEIGKDGEETLDSKDELEGVKDLMHGIKEIKESTMKINSNTFQLKKGSEEYEELESILSKIAKDNSISDVEEIRVDVSQDTGIVHFKFAGEFNPLKEYALGKGHEKAEKDLREEEERMLKEDFPEDYEEFESFEEESDLGERLQEDYPEEFRGEPDISERTDRRRMGPKNTFPKRKRR